MLLIALAIKANGKEVAINQKEKAKATEKTKRTNGKTKKKRQFPGGGLGATNNNKKWVAKRREPRPSAGEVKQQQWNQ